MAEEALALGDPFRFSGFLIASAAWSMRLSVAGPLKSARWVVVGLMACLVQGRERDRDVHKGWLARISAARATLCGGLVGADNQQHTSLTPLCGTKRA